MSNRISTLSTPADAAIRWGSYGYQDRLANRPACQSIPAEFKADYDQGYWEADFILRIEAPEDTLPHALQPIDTVFVSVEHITTKQLAERNGTCSVCGDALGWSNECSCDDEHEPPTLQEFYATGPIGEPLPYPTCGVCGSADCTTDHWANDPQPNYFGLGDADHDDDTVIELHETAKRLDAMFIAEQTAVQLAQWKRIVETARINSRNAFILEAAVVFAFAVLAGLIIALPLLSR